MSTGPFVSLFLFVVERHVDFLARAGERYLKGLFFAMFLLQGRCNHRRLTIIRSRLGFDGQQLACLATEDLVELTPGPYIQTLIGTTLGM